jgi:plastocyanin
MRKMWIEPVFALLLAACGGSRPSVVPPGKSPTGASPSVQASPRSAVAAKPEDPRAGGLEVGFGEFAIVLEATAIRPGRVTFVVHNGGKLVHGFEMKSEDGRGHSGHGGGGDRFKVEAPTFGPDDTIRIEANLPAGVYEIECYVANHEELGMRTTLRVSPDAPLVRPMPTAKNEVAIQGFAFDPGTVTVSKGAEIKWTNADPTEHTVTAANGSFASEPLPSGTGFVVTFGRAGTFGYTCAIHPSMEGTVRVTA